MQHKDVQRETLSAHDHLLSHIRSLDQAFCDTSASQTRLLSQMDGLQAELQKLAASVGQEQIARQAHRLVQLGPRLLAAQTRLVRLEERLKRLKLHP